MAEALNTDINSFFYKNKTNKNYKAALKCAVLQKESKLLIIYSEHSTGNYESCNI